MGFKLKQQKENQETKKSVGCCDHKGVPSVKKKGKRGRRFKGGERGGRKIWAEQVGKGTDFRNSFGVGSKGGEGGRRNKVRKDLVTRAGATIKGLVTNS